MNGMIIVRKYLSDTTADVLADTDLASIPNNGTLTVYAASDQSDGTLTITGTNVIPPLNGTPIENRGTGAQINVNQQIPARVQVTRGGQVTIAYTETTAATAQVVAVFVPGR